ncbi:hypothetical protein SAMN05444851_2530 [Aliiroseovarius sediminilitoris]|uniref:Sulfotransferase family protein n=1 Tax=Aliiroseovarius sediminilitoris TaxID=1173584 RepID=A0A1I0QFW5_9RHOB|nr:hypothetical protein [Aliiroseovarius sediminilitoris]SEW25994.1 hypothetical protein SAMN05444851_2530 [Aliiroseovarius sediminilitoris]
MQICFHLGAHCTDDDQLTKSLLKNSGQLAKLGVAVPGPGRYRGLLADALVKLQGARADDDTQEMLLDTLVDSTDAQRLVLGHKNFLGAPHRSIENNQLYHLAKRNTAWIRNLFANHEVSFFIGLRNPATFVPAVLSMVPAADRASLLAQIDPHSLRWSDMLLTIREANPATPIIVWCNEDTPLLWPEIMQVITGVNDSKPLDGALDILRPIMTPDGFQRMLDYLGKTEIPSPQQRRRVIVTFLEKYAIPDEIEEEIDLPGWTEAMIDDLSDAYDRDLDQIERIEGVTLLVT